MHSHTEKKGKVTGASKSQVNTNPQAQASTPFQFADNRPETLIQKNIQQLADQNQGGLDSQLFNPVQKTEEGDSISQFKKSVGEKVESSDLSKEPNETGLPDQLKTGIENLSGYSMDDVKVHYNSGKPAQLQAHAFAQGTDIHLASGQEKHLPHEAWHVVQQKQGRVRPTLQMKGGENVNDNEALEREADEMGAKAFQFEKQPNQGKSLFISENRKIKNSKVIQGAFTIKGVTLLGKTLEDWIKTYTYGHPELEVVVRQWATKKEHTEDYANDLDALSEAEKAAKGIIARSNSIIGRSIARSAPPNMVAWDSYPVWGEWYFNGLEYQDNNTGGWHSNRASLLPGNATQDGAPTRYVEFRRPGAIGEKEVDKMERCIFDLLSGRCWPNAHYDGGYVEISGVPSGTKQKLLKTALFCTRIKEIAKKMTDNEKNEAGEGFAKIEWLIKNYSILDNR
ncbi:DUF4157 domain-containing protein [Algoriphagus sp.]|uniref:eCIS core domain-containing protein n=1 Tax=Algoriphagus sp. TaxID=1872435 RepID=UPI0026385D3A|nr:DUF4157 domain-containing protein [Algoriphagus sp.]